MKKIIERILLVVCVVVFCFSAYNLFNIYLDYKEIDEEYEGIAEEYTVEKDNEYLDINWTELLNRNKDVKAWIQIPDTNINYPVLQGETNDTYIHSDIDGKDLKAGSIFIASENQNPFQDINTVIYGHNMKNGSMFNNLKSYSKQEFADEHPYVYIYLPDGTVSQYKVISSHVITDESVLYNTNITNVPEFYQAIMDKNKLSISFDQNSTQPVITLSTCVSGSGEDGRRNVVHAILERSGINPKEEKMK